MNPEDAIKQDEELLAQEDTVTPPETEEDVEQKREAGTDKYMEALGVPEHLAKALVEIVNICEKEDLNVRRSKLREWKENELYWRGIAAFYDDVAHDWRVPSETDLSAAGLPTDVSNRIYNVIKPYGESIVAALSSSFPTLAYFPDDADVEEDIQTANAASKVQKLLIRRNKAKLIFMKAIWLLYKEGVVAGRNYSHQSSKYGTYEEDKVEERQKQTHILTCVECNQSAPFPEIPPEVQNGQPVPCPACGKQMIPDVNTVHEIFSEITGKVTKEKISECIDVYGPLYVKMPWNARKQEDCGYLSLRFEQDKHLLQDVYEDFDEEIESCNSGELDIERYARLAVENSNYFAPNYVTVRQTWLRPWKFNAYGFDKEEVAELKKLFPEGCCVTIVGNDTCVDISAERLDDQWSISEHPLSNFLHADPIMTGTKPVQDAQNDVFNLAIQTIEHGIPETFADPDVLDFDAYGQEEARPGMIYRAKPAPGKGLADAFHTLKTATLSEEVSVFKASLDKAGEFETGAFPSVYGGDAGGSKTATEYQQSRSQALQRLNIIWTILSFWWSDLMGNAVVAFMENMGSDEKLVEKNGTGFVNVWIRLAEAKGRIGSIEPEAAEQLPFNWAQQRDLVMQLFQMKDESINAMLLHPNNTPVIRRIGGLDDLYIPGEDSRNKQFAEFVDLLNGAQVQVLPFEDHQIEIATCRGWLNSPTGLGYKRLFPEGYQAVVMHMQEHEMIMGQQMGQPTSPNSPAGEAPETAGDGSTVQ